MNETFGFDFNNYHLAEDAFNYISKEFSTPSTSSVLSEILSNNQTSNTPINLNSQTTNIVNLPNGNSNNGLSTSMNSLTSSSSSISSSCASSPSHHSPAPATSPSALSMTSSSCISITSSIDLQKLKSDISGNLIKPKTERSGDLKQSPINLSNFTICQSKIMENNNNNNQINNQINNQQNQSHVITQSQLPHELSEEEKEGLQISPFLSSVTENYCDITEYLTLPQNQAAKKLQMRPSTFSKRWKEASRNRKWPWRNVRKIDKEITCILHNMPKNGSISEEVENHLTFLLKQRQEELKPVVIRIS